MTRYAAETSVSVEKSRAAGATRRYRARRHAEKARALADSRALRARFPERELAWAAGMFEGEGTVTISSGGRKGYTRAVVSLTNTDREIIDWFQQRWPGRLATLRPPSPRANGAWAWTLNAGERVWRFLDDIEPFLVTTRRRRKARLAKADVDARQQGSRDAAYRQACQDRAREMRELNRRGRMPPLLGMGSGS